MPRSGPARHAKPNDTRGQQSLGDLVGLALKDISQLIRYEINLAKSEFRVDLRRALSGAALVVFILIVAYPLIIMLLFAEAYALMDLGAPGGRWGAFLWTALTVFLLVVVAAVAGVAFFKKITGMELTRKTVSEDIKMFKRAASGDGDKDGDGTRAVTEDGAAVDGDPAAVTAGPLSR